MLDNGWTEEYTRAVADKLRQAAVEEFKAAEWKALDGPDFDYSKLSAEQESLYCYAFNVGSKAAWDKKLEEADTLAMLEELAKSPRIATAMVNLTIDEPLPYDDGESLIRVFWTLFVRQSKAGGGLVYEHGPQSISRAEAEKLLKEHADDV